MSRLSSVDEFRGATDFLLKDPGTDRCGVPDGIDCDGVAGGRVVCLLDWSPDGLDDRSDSNSVEGCCVVEVVTVEEVVVVVTGSSICMVFEPAFGRTQKNFF